MTALYRKYRPINFDEVIGQEFIVKSLKNQILKNTISHAYLFSGSRGTGKTSIAKIFARAVNCENKDKAPCYKCESCKNIMDNNVDIIELDAASNNRVDEIRELRDNARYLPYMAKYKIYIIDEAHMLTESAFNALLKILEEPPLHIIFILATTEITKIPATILSRCMKFDFRLIDTENLIKYLKIVLKKEKVEFDDEALAYIASAADGSVRDCLSLTDMLIYNKAKITLDFVKENLSLPDDKIAFLLLESIYNATYGDIFSIINQYYMSGKNIRALSRSVINAAKDILYVKYVNDSIFSFERKNYINKLKLEHDFLDKIMKEFMDIDLSLSTSDNPRIILEATALNIAFAQKKTKNAMKKNQMT